MPGDRPNPETREELLDDEPRETTRGMERGGLDSGTLEILATVGASEAGRDRRECA